MSSVKQMTVRLPSGSPMHMLGLGTFQIYGPATIRETLDVALSLGYRSFDTAAVYGNEQDIGAAFKLLLPKYDLHRQDIYITTKLAPGHSPQSVPLAIEESLSNLDTSYIDLYLIHWPGASQRGGNVSPSQQRSSVWGHLVEAQKSGVVRDIGVSNYTVKHLTDLLSHPTGVKPAVNQVEWHPYCRDPALKTFCEENGIILQAYSSLGGTNNPDLLNDSDVVKISTKLGQGPAQVLLRWAIQNSVAIIPKAIKVKNLEANLKLDFEIPEEDMEILNNLYSKKQKKYAWDPKSVK